MTFLYYAMYCTHYIGTLSWARSGIFVEIILLKYNSGSAVRMIYFREISNVLSINLMYHNVCF